MLLSSVWPSKSNGDSCCVPLLSLLPGNILREDFKFLHTFSSDVAKLLKASPSQVVMVHPEKFRSKYEKASYTFTIKVSLPTGVCLSALH